jgi:hypothetical protein
MRKITCSKIPKNLRHNYEKFRKIPRHKSDNFRQKQVIKETVGKTPRQFTTEIWAFTKCSALYRVLFVGHSAKKPLPSAALGKVLLSVTSSFTECRTHHRNTLSKEVFAECRTLGEGGARQRAVSGRLELTTVNLCRGPSVGTRQRRFFAECQPVTLGKAYFYLFYFTNQTFCGMFLHYVDLYVPFWDNYNSVFYS